MTLLHAASGAVMSVRPLGEKCAIFASIALVKTQHLEVIRMTLPAGKKIAEQKVLGEITVQCLEGIVTYHAHGNQQRLHAGEMFYLAGGEPHSLQAVEDSSLLVTILLHQTR